MVLEAANLSYLYLVISTFNKYYTKPKLIKLPSLQQQAPRVLARRPTIAVTVEALISPLSIRTDKTTSSQTAQHEN